MDKIEVTSVINKRPYMEDTYLVGELKNDSFLVAVFDGHGGDAVAEFCRKSFKEILQQALLTTCQDVNIAIRGAFQSADMLVKELGISETVGSTAVIALVTPDRIWFANAGDSMAMAVLQGKPVLFSQEHKVENEKERIQGEGGMITYWDGVARVNGTLNVARAIGDHYLKKHVISDPFLRSCKRADVGYLVLASDGVWDVLSTEELYRIIEQHGLKGSTQRIVQEAIQRGSGDNITVLVLPMAE